MESEEMPLEHGTLSYWEGLKRPLQPEGRGHTQGSWASCLSLGKNHGITDAGKALSGHRA